MMIRLFVFGTLQIDADGSPEAEEVVVQPRTVALLAYLMLARPFGPRQRDHVIGMFWGELDQERARAALRKALHRLRSAIGEDTVVSRGTEMLTVSRDLMWCDATAFDDAVNDRRYREALDLYRGDLLPGFHVPEADEFGRWLEDERSYYRERAVSSAWSLVEYYERNQQLTSAAQIARVVARLASTDERMLRRVLAMLGRLGDRAGAARIYRNFADDLWRNYGTRPSAETVRLFEALQADNVPAT